MNILVTNPGRRIYFINFLLELKKKYKSINIHISDCDKQLPTMILKNVKNHLISKVVEGEKIYKKKITKIIKKNKIKLVLPLTDYDIIILSSLKNKLKDLNCRLAVPDFNTTKILNDKYKTYFFCKNKNILTPEIISKKKIKVYNKKKSIIEKEITGSASKNIRILKKNAKFKIRKDFIYQEYIKGTELHFDILNDFNGKYLTSCIKRKISMRQGETDAAETLFDEKLFKIAKFISKKIKHHGNLDCDAIVDKNGKIFFIDFNPRFGGGYPFTHLSGINFLEILVNLIQNKKIKKYKTKKIVCYKSINITKTNEKK